MRRPATSPNEGVCEGTSDGLLVVMMVTVVGGSKGLRKTRREGKREVAKKKKKKRTSVFGRYKLTAFYLHVEILELIIRLVNIFRIRSSSPLSIFELINHFFTIIIYIPISI